MQNFVITIVVALLAASCFGQESKLTPEQDQVWKMEEQYWRVFKALNRDGYIALWEENFVGWPISFPAPIRKDKIRSEPFGTLQGLELKNIQLEPKAVQIFNDVAIVYYIAIGRYVRKDGSIEVESLRMSHTWRRTNGVWRIIGGMSAPVQP